MCMQIRKMSCKVVVIQTWGDTHMGMHTHLHRYTHTHSHGTNTQRPIHRETESSHMPT